MMGEKKSFRAIAPHAELKPTSAEISAFAAERGAPTLGERKTPPEPVQKASTAPSGPIVRLNLEIPADLRRQLKKRAFEEDVTILSIVLGALAKDGFEIAEADLVGDRRRIR